MLKIDYVCILGRINLGKDDEFWSAAYNLGVTLVPQKLHLMYRGRVQSLQGCVVGAIVMKESKVLSFTLKNGNTSNLTIGIEFKVSTMRYRMSWILLNSDVFIALLGDILSL